LNVKSTWTCLERVWRVSVCYRPAPRRRFPRGYTALHLRLFINNVPLPGRMVAAGRLAVADGHALVLHSSHGRRVCCRWSPLHDAARGHAFAQDTGGRTWRKAGPGGACGLRRHDNCSPRCVLTRLTAISQDPDRPPKAMHPSNLFMTVAVPDAFWHD
jgi:hypothetical protein